VRLIAAKNSRMFTMMEHNNAWSLTAIVSPRASCASICSAEAAGGSETPDQLLPGLGAPIRTTLIKHDRVGDLAITKREDRRGNNSRYGTSIAHVWSDPTTRGALWAEIAGAARERVWR